MQRFLSHRVSRVAILTGWALYAYVFMEWLFLATMPSFMSSMGRVEKLGILFLAAFLLGLPILLVTAILGLFSRRVAAVVPALLLTCLGIILLDNFTYTVFKFGIVTSGGLLRGAYALGFLAALVLLWRQVVSWLRPETSDKSRAADYALLTLLAISAATFLVNLPHFDLHPAGEHATASTQLPNIILLGIDGVDATHTSLFGYGRETTPNIDRLASEALVAQNAFSNAGKTGGSLTSMLTGKPSTETRVIFPPNILLGEDAYQHLPGILKQHGYHTVQITMQYYGDAYDLNFRDGFDVANGRSQADYPLLGQLSRLGGGGGMYLAGEILVRIGQRLGHIFYLRVMQNPYAAVTQPQFALHDDQRMADMFRYLGEARGPLFLHIHLMDTHGPEFYVPHPYFSKPGEKNDNWNLDYYDDAIRASDEYVGQLFDYLGRTGQRASTLVIVYSDHGLDWTTAERVPLLFWFPQHEHAGSVQANVQLLDVAPTILDYLGISKPAWMGGQSLLSPNLSPARPIYSAIVNEDLLRVTDDRTTWVINEARIAPPFYQLGRLDLVVCNQWYSLDVVSRTLTYGDVNASTDACTPEDAPTPAQAASMIVQYLKDARYDVSSLPENIPSRPASQP